MENAQMEIKREIMRLRRDVEIIKSILISERELTNWAKDELKEARNRPEESYISLSEVKKRILSKNEK